MNTSDIIDAITSIVASFEQLGIDYYIGGSVVSSVYGIPQATFDVDLIADLRAEHMRDLVFKGVEGRQEPGRVAAGVVGGEEDVIPMGAMARVSAKIYHSPLHSS